MSVNNTQNKTVNLQISDAVALSLRCQGSLIVFLNCMVIVTLVFRRQKFPAAYWLQILCLALNDLIAGTANITISYIDLTYIRESLTNCSIIVVFFYSTQSASLYNIFGICVHRFVVLRKFNATSSVWKHRHTLSSTAIAWALGISLCSLPVILYRQPEVYMKIKYCSLYPIFGNNITKGMAILLGSFVVPLLFINIMYVVLFCKLRSAWKRIGPITSQAISLRVKANNTSEGSPNYANPHSTNKTTLYTNIAATSATPGQWQPANSTSKRQFYFIAKDNRVRETSEAKEKANAANQDVAPSTSSVASNCNQGVDQNERRMPTRLQRQRKAFSLLGIILLFLNIFSWPGIASLSLTMAKALSLGRNTLLPLFTSVCFNSVVNPILYAATIPEFRAAGLDILYGIRKALKC